LGRIGAILPLSVARGEIAAEQLSTINGVIAERDRQPLLRR
jgi:hypothetical protein